jgi:CheY-like chemotaxis protein
MILRREKFQALPAENPAGIQLAKKEKPDLILCNAMTPELDGYGVITILRSDKETVNMPFILLIAPE